MYSYDGLDRVTMVRYPDGNDIRYAYNAAGKVVQRIDQRGIVTSYSYDGNGNSETTDD